MADEAGPTETDMINAEIPLADAFIELANTKLEEGQHPLKIAAAMCHASANFTAFANAFAGRSAVGRAARDRTVSAIAARL